VNVIPLNGYRATSEVWPADRPVPSAEQRTQAQYRMISPSYVRTFRLPLIAGRSFDTRDDARAEPVVLISRTLAERFWTVADAVGQSLAIQDSPVLRVARVVGVVGDVKHYGLDAEVTPDIYTPIPQVPDVTVQWLANNMYWGVLTTGDPRLAGEPFRRALREVDADVPAAAIRPMEDALAIALGPRRTNVWLVRGFAMVALLLAAAGVYAVTAFTVALRRREMAIRSALGAPAARNVRDVIADAVRPMALGIAFGGAGALVASPALRSVLFQVDPFSAASFAIVAGVLLGSGTLAAVVAALPVRRIAAIEALRTE
jgi:hypothetical protein